MGQRSILQKIILIVFMLAAGAGIYALFQSHFLHQPSANSHKKTAVQPSDNGISGVIGKGISNANEWWNGSEAPPPKTSSSAKNGDINTNASARPKTAQKAPTNVTEPHKTDRGDKALSKALSALEADSGAPPPEVVDSHTVPSAKVLKEREKALLARRAVQEKRNAEIQRARIQEIRKKPRMLFAADILQARKSLGFSPQGYHLWENANGFLITNPQTSHFQLVLETGTCAGALGQDTPELKQSFHYKRLNSNTESLTLYQANQEGQSAMDRFACQVGLTFKNGTAVQATEKNCTYWHGAECAFSIPLRGLRALPDLK